MELYTAWESVPNHLKTRTSLGKMGLKPARGQQPVAHIETRYRSYVNRYDLYDVTQCVEKVVSEAQKSAAEKARQASLAKRTCARCGFVQELGRDYRSKIYVHNGLCDDCRKKFEREGRVYSDQHAAAEWARQVLARTDGVLILDTETTDLDGEVIELAIINLAGETLYNSRFCPLMEINPEAQAVHGITAEMLIDAPRFPEQWKVIADIIEIAPLILIWNAGFDISRLNETCRLHVCETFHFRKTDDLMLWYSQWVGDWSDYWGDYRWQSLGGDHSALGDCLTALASLRHMAQHELKSNERETINGD